MIRETWAQHVPPEIVLRFFIGGNLVAGEADEVNTHGPDDYSSLPEKVRFIVNWASNRDFDFVFLFDTDTFVIPSKLLSSDFWDYDVYGLIGGNTEDGKFFPWPSGCGYWLSRKAMMHILHYWGYLVLTSELAEDRLVGQILGPYIKVGELTAKSDDRYAGITLSDADYGEIVFHIARRVRKTEVAEWLRSCYGEAVRTGVFK